MFALLFLTACAGPDESKLTLKPGWKAVGDGLKSEHATQAAAATEKQVFAVSSTTVAMYDRATGKLLATSEGKAEHLNSAFVWKGKVYCAHSNYPGVPMVSSIEVLDTATLRHVRTIPVGTSSRRSTVRITSTSESDGRPKIGPIWISFPSSSNSRPGSSPAFERR